jgi:hypothetical protein
MNFLELVKERHSVRHYAQQVVEKDIRYFAIYPKQYI